MSLKLGTLIKALQTLEEAIRLHGERKDDVKLALALRDSIIQRFEYTYELSWKMIQRWIGKNVSPESAEPLYSRKELYRLAAKWGLVEDPLRWFEYHKARNLSAHTYEETNAEFVFKAAVESVDDVKYLIEQLEKRND